MFGHVYVRVCAYVRTCVRACVCVCVCVYERIYIEKLVLIPSGRCDWVSTEALLCGRAKQNTCQSCIHLGDRLLDGQY